MYYYQEFDKNLSLSELEKKIKVAIDLKLKTSKINDKPER